MDGNDYNGKLDLMGGKISSALEQFLVIWIIFHTSDFELDVQAQTGWASKRSTDVLFGNGELSRSVSILLNYCLLTFDGRPRD